MNNQRVSYRTTPVLRGDLLATINATGTLEPEDVVDVGAQVGGKIERFGPDPRDPNKAISYGTPVEDGTVLARLDDALFVARVDQSVASVAKAEADVEQAEVKLRPGRPRARPRARSSAHKGGAWSRRQEFDDGARRPRDRQGRNSRRRKPP